MCFLLTSITPFEYMLKPEEHYLDSRTGLPCSLNESLAIEVNLTATTTTPLSVVRDYDEIAFGLDQWKLADADFRNATERNNIAGTEPESIYCVKVSWLCIFVQLFKERACDSYSFKVGAGVY